jgi:hypothetical protein
MLRHRTQIRLIAFFVTAFICLNAGGALCVAYCQGFDVEAKTEHCPLAKSSEHCDKNNKGENGAIAVSDNEMDCCPMTVSFFAGPVENKQFSFDSAATASVQEFSFTSTVFVSRQRFLSDISYRGPPPLDRRINRLKHCIIRI